MYKLYLLLLLFTFSFISLASTEEKGNSTIFAEANKAFSLANEQALSQPAQAAKLYRVAALQYRFLIDQRKMKTAALYMNLGNANFFLAERGQAILNYQRALRLNPQNEDVRHNLTYLRLQLNDKLPQAHPIRDFFLKLLFWQSWSLNLRLLLFGGSFLLMWIIFARRLFSKKKNDFALLAVSGFMSVIFGISAAVSIASPNGNVDGVILAKELTARQGDGHIYEAAFDAELHSGIEFKLLQQRKNWWQIELRDGSSCWIEAQYAELISK